MADGNGKMAARDGAVEAAAKIAMAPSSAPRRAVALLPRSGSGRRKYFSRARWASPLADLLPVQLAGKFCIQRLPEHVLDEDLANTAVAFVPDDPGRVAPDQRFTAEARLLHLCSNQSPDISQVSSSSKIVPLKYVGSNL